MENYRLVLYLLIVLIIVVVNSKQSHGGYNLKKEFSSTVDSLYYRTKRKLRATTKPQSTISTITSLPDNATSWISNTTLPTNSAVQKVTSSLKSGNFTGWFNASEAQNSMLSYSFSTESDKIKKSSNNNGTSSLTNRTFYITDVPAEPQIMKPMFDLENQTSVYSSISNGTTSASANKITQRFESTISTLLDLNKTTEAVKSNTTIASISKSKNKQSTDSTNSLKSTPTTVNSTATPLSSTIKTAQTTPKNPTTKSSLPPRSMINASVTNYTRRSDDLTTKSTLVTITEADFNISSTSSANISSNMNSSILDDMVPTSMNDTSRKLLMTIFNMVMQALNKSLSFESNISPFIQATEDFRNLPRVSLAPGFTIVESIQNKTKLDQETTTQNATYAETSKKMDQRVFFYTTPLSELKWLHQTYNDSKINTTRFNTVPSPSHNHSTIARPHKNYFEERFEKMEKDAGYDDEQVTFSNNYFQSSTFRIDDYRSLKNHKNEDVSQSNKSVKIHPTNGNKLMQPYNVEKNSEFQMVVLIIGYNKHNEIVNTCTGTLISPKWIITAASCLNSNLTMYVRSPDCTENNICYEEGVRDIYFHNDFVEITDDEIDMNLSCNNIALLHLLHPWRVRIVFATIPPYQYRQDFHSMFSSCVSINFDGYLFWKADADNIFSPEQQNTLSNLTKLVVETVNSERYCSYVGFCENTECHSDWSYGYTMSTSMESGVCGADIGSPLFCTVDAKYLFMGVRSSTAGCKLGFRWAANSYLRVDAYLNWIYQITENVLETLPY